MGSVVLLLVVLARVAEVVVTTPASCRLSEFLCNTGRCVAIDNFCDGEDDCGDKSDEPPYCTPCNRTYYGDVGRTYEVEIRRPREDRLPFLCHLNFTAGGGDLGDLIQLTFDTFTVGQFVSFTSEGCPDGYMTIRELGLPSTGGQWCGSAWGYTVYYSETSSLNLTLHLYRLSEQGIGYNFDFRLAYKLLRRSEARLRYGNATWRGDLVPGTYCDRVLDGCDSRPCRIQSPNFPGVYPRNVTCYYRLEHRHVPKGKHALLAVRQRNSHKMHIKDQVVKYDRSQRVLRLWDQCNIVQDYLTVYDGNSTTDPILVRLCGGDVLPDIVSSGPSMLLVFHTSSYDNPFHPVPLSYLPGFELEVQVLTVESSSYRYIPRSNRQCEFLLTSFDSLRGQLETPRHSLPPNSVCRYHFQGRRNRETVWISFVKYQVSVYDHLPQTDQCSTRLRLWDGRHDPTDHQVANASLLGQFCKDEVPKLCDHSLLSNSSRFTRPCSLSESYVSTGSELTLELSLRHGSALYPVSFLLRYEFVDTMLGGSPFDSSSSLSGSCDRIFMSDSGTFQSPRSIFLFGRGGATDLSCVSRFQTQKRDYTVRLTFTRARFGERMCQSLQDPRTGRWRCRMFSTNSNSVAEMWVSEYPWPGVRMPRDCFCSTFTEPLVVTGLTSSLVEVNFTVTNMNITQDFSDFYFEGEYEFVPKPDADSLCSATRDERRLRGSSGEIELGDSVLQDVHDERSVQRNVCVNYPWLIEPVDPLNNFLYLKIRGVELTDVRQHCDVLNRIVVYTGTSLRHPRVVCPSEHEYHMVEVFSEGWNRSSSGLLEVHHARSFVLEFTDREPGSFFVTWMEVSKRPLLSSSYVSNPPLDCPYRCPELNACISVALWCDGSRHCPSGYDEDDVNCVALYQRVPLLYIGIGAGALSLLSLLIAVSAAGIKCRQQQRKRRRKVQVSNGDAKRCYAANPHHDMFLDKDSLC